MSIHFSGPFSPNQVTRNWSQSVQDCFLPKEAMCTQVALWFLWSNICVAGEFPLCLIKQSVWTHKLRKFYCFKRLWSERNDWIWLHLFIKGETFPSSHIIRPTSTWVTSWGVKQATVTWIATWFRAWAVLFSLPGIIMGRETVYLCHDFRRFSKADEIGMQTNPERGTLQQTS